MDSKLRKLSMIVRIVRAAKRILLSPGKLSLYQPSPLPRLWTCDMVDFLTIQIHVTDVYMYMHISYGITCRLQTNLLSLFSDQITWLELSRSSHS